MVARRGRGAKNQPAKPKPSEPAAEAAEAEVTEQVEATEDNNGDAQAEQTEEAAGGEDTTEAQPEEAKENKEEEPKPEEPKEEKVESGKLLVENLPPSCLFDYQDKLKELFSKHGEVTSVKRGPIIVTELTTTPTLSAIVEFKNKDSLEKALAEEGTMLDGCALAVAVESRAETAVLVGVPYEASTDYVRLLFAQCGDIAHIHEFSKTKYKICEYIGRHALAEEGTMLDGCALAVAVESRAETAVLVGVPYEASTDYVRLLFAQCGDIAHIHEFSKTKYKICEYIGRHALAEEGTMLDGCALAVAVESRAETAVLVGVPYEASTDYVRLLFAQCGDIAHIHEFSKTKYKICEYIGRHALAEEGTMLDGCALAVAVESRAETAVLVGVPYEASTDYVRLLFAQCGDIAHIHEFSKTKYKICEYIGRHALAEEGTMLDGCALAVAVESRAETAVLVGVPYEASTDYVRLLFAQCGDIAHIHEFSKTKYKICEYIGRHALAEEGTMLDGCALAVAVESRAETAVLVGVPYEASTDYVRLLFAQCGDIAHIHEFSKTKYKICEYIGRHALAEEGTMLDGCALAVAVESRAETAVLVGVPYEASTDYVRLLFAQCGDIAHIHEFSKTKYKICEYIGRHALAEEGTMLDGCALAVAVESRAETAVLVGVPYEASTDYVRLLFAQCGDIAHIHEFSKTKYKICEYIGRHALAEEGTMLDGCALAVAVESRAETAVLVGVPYEASTDYVRLLFAQCGDIAHIHEFSKTKYKICEYIGRHALAEEGTMLDGCALAVAVESRAETAVLVGVPYEASTDYVRLLFAQCGDIAHIHEFSKTKYKICEYIGRHALAEEGTMLDGCALAVAVESRAETAVLVGVPYEASTDYVRLLFAQCGDIAHIHEFSKTKYKICEYIGRHALAEEGTMLDGCALAVAVESRAETAVLVGVPYEASTDYVRLLFAQCGDIAHIHEFSKTQYKILRVTFHEKKAVEKALKLDRELRINGFLVTVSKYRDEDEQKAHAANTNKNKRQHAQQNRNNAPPASSAPPAARQNNFRPRGGGGGAFNARGNFRGGRGRGFGARGGAFPRGGFAPVNSYMPPQPFMGRPQGYMNDGQRPNKRLRQM